MLSKLTILFGLIIPRKHPECVAGSLPPDLVEVLVGVERVVDDVGDGVEGLVVEGQPAPADLLPHDVHTLLHLSHADVEPENS